MKVLYLPIGENYGGAQRRLARIFNGLYESDTQWKLVLRGSAKYVEDFCKKEQINADSVIAFCGKKEAIKYLCSEQIDTLWFFDINSVILSVLLFRSKKTKCVMTVANYYYSIMEFSNIKIKTAFLYALRKADYVDCLYPSSVEILKGKTKKDNVFATPMPFTVKSLFKPKNKEKKIVFAARLIKNKNAMLLLESAYDIRSFLLQSGYKVLICGDGPAADSVIQFIEQNNLSNVVEYAGKVQTQDVLPYSSIFVSLMRGENYPSQSLIEAISSGNYCIVGKGRDTDKILKPAFGKEITLNRQNLSDAIIDAVKLCNTQQASIIEESVKFADENFIYNNSVEYFKTITK